MKTPTFPKFVITFVVAMVIAVTGFQLTTDSAWADTRCRINGPFGSWTEGCPHVHVPDDPDSQVGGPSGPVQSSRYPVRVQNNCTDTIRLALLYQDSAGNYQSVGMWTLAGSNTSNNLSHQGSNIQIAPGSTVYYHAYSDRFSWNGDIYRYVNSTNYGFKEYGTLSNQGDHLRMTLRCDSAHIAWGDDRTKTLSMDSSHRWTFDASAGMWAEITMSSSALDSYLILYAPNGAEVARDDDGLGYPNARIRVDNLPQSGTYTIVARGLDSSETGTYTLTLD